MLRIVGDKTGYPVEMLELGMDMEADLGIDSIKRVEILGAMREEFPSLPQFSPEELGELRTLQQIVDYMEEAGRRESAPFDLSGVAARRDPPFRSVLPARSEGDSGRGLNCAACPPPINWNRVHARVPHTAMHTSTATVGLAMQAQAGTLLCLGMP